MGDQATLEKFSKPRALDLDVVWEEVNALGGAVADTDRVGVAINETVGRVLDIIEAHGGMDPAERRRRGEQPR